MDQTLYRAISAPVLEADYPNTAVGLFARLRDRIGLDGPVLSVGSISSPLTAALKDWAQPVFLFPPRSLRGTLAGQPMPAGPWDMSDVPVYLADRDRDVEEVAAGSLVRIRPEKLRLRRTDTLFEDLAACALFHIADAAHSAGVLDGARALLARTKPFVLIDLALLSPTPRIAQLERIGAILKPFGYGIVDGTLFPIASPEDWRQAILIGGETCFLAVPPRVPLASFIGRMIRRSLRTVDDELTPLEAHTASVLQSLRMGVHAKPRPPRGTILKFDDTLVCEGFYPTEYYEDASWRWAGPRPEARFTMPVPRAGHYTLLLKVLDSAHPRCLERLTLFALGQRLTHRVERGEYETQIYASLEIPADEFSGWIEIIVSYGETHRKSGDDQRQLGLCLSGGELLGSGD